MSALDWVDAGICVAGATGMPILTWLLLRAMRRGDLT